MIDASKKMAGVLGVGGLCWGCRTSPGGNKVGGFGGVGNGPWLNPSLLFSGLHDRTMGWATASYLEEDLGLRAKPSTP